MGCSRCLVTTITQSCVPHLTCKYLLRDFKIGFPVFSSFRMCKVVIPVHENECGVFSSIICHKMLVVSCDEIWRQLCLFLFMCQAQRFGHRWRGRAFHWSGVVCLHQWEAICSLILSFRICIVAILLRKSEYSHGTLFLWNSTRQFSWVGSQCGLMKWWTLHYLEKVQSALKDMCFVENLQATDSFCRMFNIILIDRRQRTVLIGHIKLTYLVLIGPTGSYSVHGS